MQEENVTMKPALSAVLTTTFAFLVGIAGVAHAELASSPSPPAVPGVQLIAGQEMTVSNGYGYANLRKEPSSSAQLVEKLPQGTKVIIIEKVLGGTWTHVKVGAKDGYIKTILLK
jgi:hypothetical protein